MVFFKRLSRSRSSSQGKSYVDPYDSHHDSKTNSASYDDNNNKYAAAAPVAASPTTATHDPALLPVGRTSNSEPLSAKDPAGMYPRTNQPTEVYANNNSMSQQQQQQQQQQYATPPTSAGGARQNNMSNGYGNGGYDEQSASGTTRKNEAAPDLLLQAFNQALRPHVDKVENLESEIADLNKYIAQLESQQREVHAWIDKRGLRPDVPASIAHQMDSLSHDTSPTHAAATLNAQLDRKITIVNFDLHRLQDDLNDSLPTPSFSACMLKFLPDIARLNALPSGPRYGFDLLLKLGGNLNSHGGLENQEEEDLAERRAFYGKLDAAMVEVVRGRFREEGDSWGVQREVKRIEKTGAYLRNWGVEPYFPGTLEAMREGGGGGQAAGGAGVGGEGAAYS